MIEGAYTKREQPELCLRCGLRRPRNFATWTVICLRCARSIAWQFKLRARALRFQATGDPDDQREDEGACGPCERLTDDVG